MSYQINDTAPNIVFELNGRVFLLAKKRIEEIVLIREDIIKISTRHCTGDIRFRHRDVMTPSTISATALVSLLNTWLGPTDEK